MEVVIGMAVVVLYMEVEAEAAETVLMLPVAMEENMAAAEELVLIYLLEGAVQ